MTALSIPEVTGLSPRDAALAYAEAGWYVGPLKHRTKHPGSVLGAAWPSWTSRDPAVIRRWFSPGTRHGVFLHVGRSGAVVFDVDRPDALHQLIVRAVNETAPPWQTTRPATPLRRHIIFRVPPGRQFGNGLGDLANGWGEVRGRNGVIVVAPSAHEDHAGEYAWGRTGAVPVLPDYLADALPDAAGAAGAVSDAEVAAFVEEHDQGARLDALDRHYRSWEKKVDAGESRHDSLTGHLQGALKEAAAGLYPAEAALDRFHDAFVGAVTAPGHGEQGAARSYGEAETEWQKAVAWAVGQAQAADPAVTRQRTAQLAPGPADDFDVWEKADDELEDEGEDGARFTFRTGGAFVLDTSPDAVPIWGSGSEVLWADGEALILASPQGLGKTTLGQQAALARCGLLVYDLLGYPIEEGRGRVLYLAMDRPKQAARSFQRMVAEEARADLDDRLVVWEGPPPQDMALNTKLLAEMCAAAGADTVVVDSLKDAALNLSEDGPGSGWNRARQTALQAGVQVLELHHNRKRQQSSGKTGAGPGIDEIYGSTWITSGAGSVLLLTGQPGDLIVGLHHVKQPADPVGPLQLLHNHDVGMTTVHHAADLLSLAAATAGGITARQAAEAMFDTDEPTANEKKKAERRLNRLVRDGRLCVVQQGDAGSKTPTKWGR